LAIDINGIDYRRSATLGILTHENYTQKIQFIFCKWRSPCPLYRPLI